MTAQPDITTVLFVQKYPTEPTNREFGTEEIPRSILGQQDCYCRICRFQSFNVIYKTEYFFQMTSFKKRCPKKYDIQP
jgi:hypothetical protein